MNRDDWPWSELSDTTLDALEACGLDTVEKIAAIHSYREIARRAGLGKWQGQRIRRLIPRSGTSDSRPVLQPAPMRGNGRGGQLRTGNPGGPGPSPSIVRKEFRKATVEVPAILAAIMNSPETKEADKLRAADIAAKYGLGLPKGEQGVGVETLEKLVRGLADATVPFLADEGSIPELEDAWRAVIKAELPEEVE